MVNLRLLDLFAGPGGWDLAATRLGLDPLGIEWDDAACATREAVGLRTVQADVSALDPLDYAPCDILIASPPCQAWSMAGKRGGERDKEHVIACALELAAGNDTRAEHRAECEDERSLLVVEALRWALALRPAYLAFEQVPPVLELWTMFAEVLRGEGYSVWAGVLEAERYGIPQTRERAVLIASRVSTVHPPRATHQRYVPGQPPRHDVTLEGEVLPWVSMAQALGWQEGPSPSPSPSVTGGGGQAGGVEVFASKAARGRAAAAVVQTNNFSAIARDSDGKRSKAGSVPYTRPVDNPAPTIDTHAQSWALDRRQGGAPVRSLDEPAHTMASQGLGKGRDVWVQRERSGERAEEGFDPAEEPCQTLTSKARSWTVHRPSPTVVTSPGDRVACPTGGGKDVSTSERGGVRVTQQQAATLQTFPPDYPWQGSRSKQFEQIGNAVPPLLAEHVLRALLPAESSTQKAA